MHCSTAFIADIVLDDSGNEEESNNAQRTYRRMTDEELCS